MTQYNSELLWRRKIVEEEKGSSTTTYFQPAPESAFEYHNVNIKTQRFIYRIHRQIRSLTYNANSMEIVASALAKPFHFPAQYPLVLCIV